MNLKKKSIILSVILIISIQILLLINNRHKTSLRYFIWDIENISIGRLICISFISGLLMKSILSKTLNNTFSDYTEKEEKDKTNDENGYSINRDAKNESDEMPPERDLRETQPTISVNYRVIKDNGDIDFKDREEKSNKSQDKDDWYNYESEW